MLLMNVFLLVPVFLMTMMPLSFAKDKPVKAGDGMAAMKLPDDVTRVIQERGLKPDDILGAVSTFMPSGQYDEYTMFASGGHGGQIFVIGLPSMRLLRTIAVFEAESWQGYGFGVEETPLMGVPIGGDGQKAGWADTHHPALSETAGEYDGQFLFIGDKSHGRIAVIDLRDFETKQFADGKLMHNDHGGCFVTPNSEYVIEGAQYAEPLGNEYAPISEYKEKYRGLATFWKFDRAKGRIDIENSFAVELPPYWQDLADAGKGPSEGWAFMNSFNTEMATGGIEKGNPPFEAGTTQRDMDYLHVFNWKKAEEVMKAGKFEVKNGFKLITLKTAIDEGILFFIPEPKSPHGVDVTPSGKFMVVAGKLDPHVTIYSFDKMIKAIAAKDYEGVDEYGVPILRFDAVKEAQVELGLGPLHTQFDNQGYAYTSLFLESAVARWTLGDDKFKAPEKPWTLVGKVPVQFNIGHLATAEGDTVSPDGKHLVALNKWSVDRYAKLGPLLPQNLQLVDIGKTGDSLKVLYDMPMGSGEPHYAQIIKSDKLKTWDVYPEVGWNTLTQSKSDKVALEGKVIREGNNVEIFMPLIRSHFDPEHIEIEQGQHVTMHLTNLERTIDATHGFSIAGFNIAASIEPGETVTIQFTADKPGVYPYYCLEFCSALHLEMTGYLMVKPKK
jgi:nitrous-oxide reductase